MSSLHNGDVNGKADDHVSAGAAQAPSPAPAPASTSTPATPPKPDVAPDQVEKSLLDESKKAGAPGFQFDPNASPEDKAEAAKNVCYMCLLCFFLFSYTMHVLTWWLECSRRSSTSGSP